jgi:prepilin-type N-terminal cleavage/methylation domain-containing protein
MKISVRKLVRNVGLQTASGPTSRQGVALIEVIVAMVLLAVAVSSLAALVYSVSQNGMIAAGNAYRNGVVMQEVNRLEGLPYDSIRVGVVSTSVSTGAYPHTRTVTIAEPVAAVVKTVKVIVSPVNPRYKPDTISFIRTKARSSRALCTTCA